MKIDDVRKAFAMPATSPAFPPGPYRFVQREFVIITGADGVTVAADAALVDAVVAARAAAPFIRVRRSRDRMKGKVSGVVMVSSDIFCWEEDHVPAIRHKSGRLDNFR